MPTIRAGSVVSWDPVVQGTDGSPKLVVMYEVALSSSTDDLNSGGTVLRLMTTEQPSFRAKNLIGSVVAGNYRVWVRSVDNLGLKSVWAGPANITVEASEALPAAPSNFSIA